MHAIAGSVAINLRGAVDEFQRIIFFFVKPDKYQMVTGTWYQFRGMMDKGQGRKTYSQTPLVIL